MLFYSIYIFLVIKEYFSHVCKGTSREFTKLYRSFSDVKGKNKYFLRQKYIRTEYELGGSWVG